MFQSSALCVEAKVKSESVSCSVTSDSLQPYGLKPASPSVQGILY